MAPALDSDYVLRVEGRPVLLLQPGADPVSWRKTADLFLVQRGGVPSGEVLVIMA